MTDTRILARKFTCDEDRLPTKKQHVTPCAGCPWTDKSFNGYLGNNSIDEWLQMIHGEHIIDCHNTTNQQCAGAAIFRANVLKSPRSPEALRLKPGYPGVFKSDEEFRKHHSRRMNS